jgi:hypothetical protein
VANTYTLIGSPVVIGAGGAPTIGFTSIPATYTDLVIKASLRGTSNPFLSMSFNGSSASFNNRQLGIEGTTKFGLSRTDTFIGYGQVNPNATANVFSNTEIYISDYATSANKSFIVDYGSESNTNTDEYRGITNGIWSNSAAITSVTLSGDFAQYSAIFLYGINKS